MTDNIDYTSDYYEAYPAMIHILPGFNYEGKNISNYLFILRQAMWVLAKILDNNIQFNNYDDINTYNITELIINKYEISNDDLDILGYVISCHNYDIEYIYNISEEILPYTQKYILILLLKIYKNNTFIEKSNKIYKIINKNNILYYENLYSDIITIIDNIRTNYNLGLLEQVYIEYYSLMQNKYDKYILFYNITLFNTRARYLLSLKYTDLNKFLNKCNELEITEDDIKSIISSIEANTFYQSIDDLSEDEINSDKLDYLYKDFFKESIADDDETKHDKDEFKYKLKTEYIKKHNCDYNRYKLFKESTLECAKLLIAKILEGKELLKSDSVDKKNECLKNLIDNIKDLCDYLKKFSYIPKEDYTNSISTDPLYTNNVPHLLAFIKINIKSIMVEDSFNFKYSMIKIYDKVNYDDYYNIFKKYKNYSREMNYTTDILNFLIIFDTSNFIIDNYYYGMNTIAYDSFVGALLHCNDSSKTNNTISSYIDNQGAVTVSVHNDTNHKIINLSDILKTDTFKSIFKQNNIYKALLFKCIGESTRDHDTCVANFKIMDNDMIEKLSKLRLNEDGHKKRFANNMLNGLGLYPTPKDNMNVYDYTEEDLEVKLKLNKNQDTDKKRLNFIMELIDLANPIKPNNTGSDNTSSKIYIDYSDPVINNQISLNYLPMYGIQLGYGYNNVVDKVIDIISSLTLNIQNLSKKGISLSSEMSKTIDKKKKRIFNISS